MTSTEAQELVDSTTWYHGWEIVPGVHTPGGCKINPKQVLDFYGVPEDLTGIRALDIGAWDGPYSFELERRGAEVVSLDIQDSYKTGYDVAREILNSDCKYIRTDICELKSRDMVWVSMRGSNAQRVLADFDLILYMGVFYHLKEPMRAWEAIKTVMKPDATLYFEGLVFDYAWNSEIRLHHKRAQIEAVRDLPIVYFAAGEYGYDSENWYVPTMTCLYDWLIASGFDVQSMGLVEDASRNPNFAYPRSRAYGTAKVKG